MENQLPDSQGPRNQIEVPKIFHGIDASFSRNRFILVERLNILLPYNVIAENWGMSINIFKKAKSYCIDSGAFSAYTRGFEINVDRYIRDLHVLLGILPTKPFFVAALDAIGNARKSWENFRAMRDSGLDVVPVWHVGEPFELLDRYRQQCDFIGIGALVGRRKESQQRAIQSVFDRIYPCKIHLFGVGSLDILQRFPFYTCDYSSVFTAAIRSRVIKKYKKTPFYELQDDYVVLALHAVYDDELRKEAYLRAIHGDRLRHDLQEML